MSERKVLTKYYPPDFDPSKLERSRGGKSTGPKSTTVRLMAPFSMRCTACGEYIYKGRKFNARKETAAEKYLTIPIFRFYIRCTRCSGEIVFRTDPKNMDYIAERGAKRNFEPWREERTEETDQERLDRLEQEELEKDAMGMLEAKTVDAKTEMAIADALDEIRSRNARNEMQAEKGDVPIVRDVRDEERERQEREDEEAAKRAFESATGEKIRRLVVDEEVGAAPLAAPVTMGGVELGEGAPLFKRMVKKKKDFGAALGIKKKKPGLV
ncbi:DUF572-domain-containing protein [Trichodelitschia bisporula]|uniref:Splicing factor YJU2 n=1 Tax=Trichodelitschia bisporula TaxID=703511 RepID=A0A6G1I4I0_9PEZI|nr:DUF572-domain-containing protein [Trichodelitschia bisporula]